MRSIFVGLYRASAHGGDSAELTLLGREGTGRGRRDPDLHRGAIEGDRPGDRQQWNRNAPGLDDRGLPEDCLPVAEDAIGANEDESQG